MIKLFITDLDDTLYSWMGFFIPAFYGMAEEVSGITGIDLNKLLDEYKKIHQLKRTVEYPYATILLPSIRDYYLGLNESKIKEKLQPAFDVFNNIREDKLQLFPGVSETIQTLAKKGVRIIGFTDSGELNGFYRLQKLGISELFARVYVTNYEYRIPDYIIRDGRVREAKNGKPDPKLIDSILVKEGVEKSETLYTGDSLTKDIYMAYKAGIKSIQCKHPVNYDVADYYQKLIRITSWTKEDFDKETKLKELCKSMNIEPDYVVNGFSEILNILHSTPTFNIQ